MLLNFPEALLFPTAPHQPLSLLLVGSRVWMKTVCVLGAMCDVDTKTQWNPVGLTIDQEAARKGGSGGGLNHFLLFALHCTLLINYTE